MKMGGVGGVSKVGLVGDESRKRGWGWEGGGGIAHLYIYCRYSKGGGKRSYFGDK